MPEDRRAISKAIWLCQNCAKLVDNDASRFTVELLRSWKTVAEDLARDRIGRAEREPQFAASEESRARQMYSMAVFLLRRVSGTSFNNQGLAAYLLAEDANNARAFWRTVETLGEIEPLMGRFKPHTEPSNFHVDDTQALKAAEKIVRAYITASERKPDFADIMQQYALPDPDEARSLLRYECFYVAASGCPPNARIGCR